MTITGKKRHFLSTLTVSLSCSGSCKRPKLSDAVYQPQPRSSSSSSSTSDTNSEIKAARGFGSMAVEKDSDDPYLDFRQSMMEMILEKEIYSREGLRELLDCFLRLNSPYYHGTIVRAFTEIWNWVFSTAGTARSRDLHGMWTSRDR